MDEEKELELSLDKVYTLPKFKIVSYNECYLAIAPESAKWIVLENTEQLDILNMFLGGASIESVSEQFSDFQDDVINVLTQFEAKQIETSESKSVFTNTRLHLHLTNKCNLHCPHCYMKSGTAYDDELSADEIKKLCLDFSNSGGTDVSLTGGEPTVRKDFMDIAEYISSIGMKISVFSNGFLWDSDMVEKFGQLNIEGVQISIDGYNEETNAVIRGKGVFDRALNAVDLFVKNNIYVKIAVTAPYELIREHQKDYIEFAKGLINKYGDEALEINFSYFFMPGRELSADKISQIKEEYYNFVDEVVKSVYSNITEDAFVSNISDYIYDSCGYGGLNVMANGDFYFCDRIPDSAKIGNIRNTEFSEIFSMMKKAEIAGRIDNFKRQVVK